MFRVLMNPPGVIFYSMSALLPQGSLYIFTSDPIQIGYIALPNGFLQVSLSQFKTLIDAQS